MKFVLIVAATALVSSSVAVPTADAGRAERKFRGKIIVLKKRPPMRFRSSSHVVRFMRANRAKYIWPIDEKTRKRKIDGKLWVLEFTAFFRKPLNDFEAKVRFVDITRGKRFVAGDSIQTGKKGQTVLSSYLEVTKPRFKENRRYRMQILNRAKQVLADTTFWLRGRGERYSGKVTFSDDEASK